MCYNEKVYHSLFNPYSFGCSPEMGYDPCDDVFGKVTRMRNRVLNTQSRLLPTCGHAYSQVYRNATFPPIQSEGVASFVDQEYTKTIGNISDELSNPPPEVYVDPISGRWRRYRRSRSPIVEIGGHQEGLMRSQLKPVHRCVHSKIDYKLLTGLTFALESHDFAGNYLYDRDTTNTYSNCDGGQVISLLSAASINDTLTGSNIRFTAGDYLNHDWFAIMSSFNESCDQFIHSSTLIGESIIENAIFVDAFKLVINPTSAIKTLIKLGQRFKRHRKMNLGQMSQKLMKGSANANLFYQFGIKPAISDIRDAFHAHERVSQRLKILRSNAGRYIPIRVKDELFSSHSNELPATDDTLDFQWTMRHKRSIAHAGAWGRVRSDLQFSDTWSAYLQYFGINKMVGLVWELIPFSFVVDWFTNTQERINYYTRDRTGGPFEDICNVYSSVKQEELLELNLVPGRFPAMANTYITVPSSHMPIVERLSTYYTRIPSIPDTSGVFDFSALGLFHALTSGSLIIQRWR
jgi:hypothetical protein